MNYEKEYQEIMKKGDSYISSMVLYDILRSRMLEEEFMADEIEQMIGFCISIYLYEIDRYVENMSAHDIGNFLLYAVESGYDLKRVYQELLDNNGFLTQKLKDILVQYSYIYM